MPYTERHRGIDSDFVATRLRSAASGEPFDTPDEGTVPPGTFLERESCGSCDRSHYSGRSYYGPGSSWAGVEVRGEPQKEPPWTVRVDLPLLRLRGWAEGTVAILVYRESDGGSPAAWRRQAVLPGRHPLVGVLVDGEPGIARDWLAEDELRGVAPHLLERGAVANILWALLPRSREQLRKLGAA